MFHHEQSWIFFCLFFNRSDFKYSTNMLLIVATEKSIYTCQAFRSFKRTLVVLLKGNNLIQPTILDMITGQTPFFRSGQPHKPSFLQLSRCQAVWMQLSVNIAILSFILYSPIHYSIFLEEIFIIDLEFRRERKIQM